MDRSKKLFRAGYVLGAAAVVGSWYVISRAHEKEKLADRTDKVSYSLGYQVGESLKKQRIEVDLEAYTAGIRDAVGGAQALLSKEEIRATITDLQKRITSEQRKHVMETLAEGQAFLEQNKRKEGVRVLPSGLQYKVLAEGSGKTAKADDTVTVHYRGTLVDGTEFDSSWRKGVPATFKVNRVFRGWGEALQLMKEGDKWQLVLPPELAYGRRGAGRIRPNSTLIFEVELISVGTAAAR